MRHYQRFLKKQAEIRTTNEHAAEAFEYDCVWEGWLGPRLKGGRPKKEEGDIFERIATRVVASANSSSTQQRRIRRQLDQLLVADGGGDRQLEKLASQLRKNAQDIGRYYDLDTLEEMETVADDILTPITDSNTAEPIDSRTVFFERYSVIMQELFRYACNVMNHSINWPSHLFRDIDSRLSLDDLPTSRFYSSIIEVIDTLEERSPKASSLFQRCFFGDQELPDAAEDLEMPMDEAQKYWSLSRVLIKEQVEKDIKTNNAKE